MLMLILSLNLVQKTPGFWDGLEFYNSDDINNQLNFVTVEYGGATDADANLRMYDGGSFNRIEISNSTFRHGLGFGLIFSDDTLVDQFVNNISTGNALGSVQLPANIAGSLDAASDYTGNTVDLIHIVSSSTVTKNQTWPATNASYSLGSNYVNAGLAIEAGAVLEFRSGGLLEIAFTGTLSAIGTGDLPILFTGEQKSNGFWRGVQFYNSNHPDNILDYVTVEYGGGGSTTGSNIKLSTGGSPTQATIIHSILQHSSGWGIVLTSDAQINSDIATSNQFNDNPSGSILFP